MYYDLTLYYLLLMKRENKTPKLLLNLPARCFSQGRSAEGAASKGGHTPRRGQVPQDANPVPR